MVLNVVAGVLENDCKVINEIYNYNSINKQPFVSMKVASSIDGKIALSVTVNQSILPLKPRERLSTT